MARQTLLLGTLVAVAIGAVLFFRDRAGQSAESNPMRSTLEDVKTSVGTIWEVPANGLKYLPAITSAAQTHGVPMLLLARLLYQESHFRDSIISGNVLSSAGAIGIAQFLPATAKELGVDPYDPYSSIDGAARYLRQLYDRLTSWDKALAAYNWGIGNVTRKGLASAPTETKLYVDQILKDIGL